MNISTFFILTYLCLFTYMFYNLYYISPEHFTNSSNSKINVTGGINKPYVFLPSNDSYKENSSSNNIDSAKDAEDQYPVKLTPIKISKENFAFSMEILPEPIQDAFNSFKSSKNGTIQNYKETEEQRFNRFMVPVLWQTCNNLMAEIQPLKDSLQNNENELKNIIPQIKTLNNELNKFNEQDVLKIREKEVEY